MSTFGSIGARVRVTVGVAMATLTACSSAPVAVAPSSSPTSLESSGMPGPAEETDPQEQVLPLEGSAATGGDWTRTRINVEGSVANTATFMHAPGGGYLFFGNVADPENPEDNYELRAWRITPTGDVDTTFGDNGFTVLLDHYNVESYSIRGSARHPDGSVILMLVAIGDTWSDIRLIKLEADGAIDEDYPRGRPPAATSSTVYDYPKRTVAMASRADGSIWICANTNEGPKVVAFRPDGSRDEAFGPDGERDLPAPAAEGCAGGATLKSAAIFAVEDSAPDAGVGAGSANSGQTAGIRLIAIGSDGARDPGFGNSILTRHGYLLHPQHLRVARDGASFVQGVAAPIGSTRFRDFVAKADSTGAWDSGFGEQGIVLLNPAINVRSIDLAGSRVLLSGYESADDSDPNANLMPLVSSLRSDDGSVDRSFGRDGTFSPPRIPTRVLIDADRRLITDGAVQRPGNAWFELVRNELRVPA